MPEILISRMSTQTCVDTARRDKRKQNKFKQMKTGQVQDKTNEDLLDYVVNSSHPNQEQYSSNNLAILDDLYQETENVIKNCSKKSIEEADDEDECDPSSFLSRIGVNNIAQPISRDD